MGPPADLITLEDEDWSVAAVDIQLLLEEDLTTHTGACGCRSGSSGGLDGGTLRGASTSRGYDVARRSSCGAFRRVNHRAPRVWPQRQPDCRRRRTALGHPGR